MLTAPNKPRTACFVFIVIFSLVRYLHSGLLFQCEGNPDHHDTLQRQTGDIPNTLPGGLHTNLWEQQIQLANPMHEKYAS